MSAPILSGGQGRTPDDIADGGVACIVVAFVGMLAIVVLLAWRAMGGGR